MYFFFFCKYINCCSLKQLNMQNFYVYWEQLFLALAQNAFKNLFLRW